MVFLSFLDMGQHYYSSSTCTFFAPQKNYKKISLMIHLQDYFDKIQF